MKPYDIKLYLICLLGQSLLLYQFGHALSHKAKPYIVNFDIYEKWHGFIIALQCSIRMI